MSTVSGAALIDRLHAIVGPAGLVRDPADQQTYLRDWGGKWQGRTLVVVRPADTQAMAEVVRLCGDTHTPLVPQGGHTGMSGGATPDDSGAQVVVSTTRMNRVREVDAVNGTMTVDAGVLLAQAQAAAEGVGCLFPLSLGAEGSCTVGGNLATNAGGTAVLRYGNMRDLVLGLEVVLPDGRIWHGLRALRKDNTGYDLRHLFIGSEGTLGVITGAVLKLFAAQPARATAWVGAASLADLVTLMTELRSRSSQRLTAFEMMSAASLDLVLEHVSGARAPLTGRHRFHALIELRDAAGASLDALLEPALQQALSAGQVQDVMVCTSDAQTQALWKLREGISQAQVRAGKAIKHDIALPISQLAAFVPKADAVVARLAPGAGVINFGHLGDGNLHYNLLLPLDTGYDVLHDMTEALNRAVHDLVAGHAGSISAEHGIGQLRRDELRHYKSPVEMDLMLRIKQAIDPNQIMNPGKLL